EGRRLPNQRERLDAVLALHERADHLEVLGPVVVRDARGVTEDEALAVVPDERQERLLLLVVEAARVAAAQDEHRVEEVEVAGVDAPALVARARAEDFLLRDQLGIGADERDPLTALAAELLDHAHRVVDRIVVETEAHVRNDQELLHPRPRIVRRRLRDRRAATDERDREHSHPTQRFSHVTLPVLLERYSDPAARSRRTAGNAARRRRLAARRPKFRLLPRRRIRIAPGRPRPARSPAPARG